MRYSPRTVGIAVGIALLVAAGGVAMAARSGGERAGTLRIASLTAETPGGGSGAPAARGAEKSSRGSGNSRSQPAPAPTPAPPPPPRSLFADQQVVAYYGNPYSATMGVLGEYQGDELIRRVKAQAAKYQELNPEKKIIAALHLVYAVAQGRPGEDGTYLFHMPDEMVENFIETTRANGMLFILDMQNGRRDPVREAESVLKWLRHEHVHLAVDPEFTWKPNEFPNEDIGTLDGETINRIQDLLQQTALEAGIANKILIVHQFRPDMIENKSAISDRERVDLVIDMDGWGPPPGKYSKYEVHVKNEPVEYAGIKLFYRWDKPMLTETEVQGLIPRPHIIIYQ
jgi:hypothetical protein